MLLLDSFLKQICTLNDINKYEYVCIKTHQEFISRTNDTDKIYQYYITKKK